jgi:hypothetical protein
VSGRESGWEGVDFTGFRIYPNFRCRERGREAARTPRFWMFPRGCGTRSRVDFIFLIGEGIAHAKDGKDGKEIQM